MCKITRYMDQPVTNECTSVKKSTKQADENLVDCSATLGLDKNSQSSKIVELYRDRNGFGII